MIFVMFYIYSSPCVGSTRRQVIANYYQSTSRGRIVRITVCPPMDAMHEKASGIFGLAPRRVTAQTGLDACCTSTVEQIFFHCKGSGPEKALTLAFPARSSGCRDLRLCPPLPALPTPMCSKPVTKR